MSSTTTSWRLSVERACCGFGVCVDDNELTLVPSSSLLIVFLLSVLFLHVVLGSV